MTETVYEPAILDITSRDYDVSVQDLIRLIEDVAQDNGGTFEDTAAEVIYTVWNAPRDYVEQGGPLFAYLFIDEDYGNPRRQNPRRFGDIRVQGSTKNIRAGQHCGCLTEIRLRASEDEAVYTGILLNDGKTFLPVQQFTDRVVGEARIPVDMTTYLFRDPHERNDPRQMSREEVIELLNVFAEYQAQFDHEAAQVYHSHVTR